ncbi:MAG: hypothetical protein ACD_30C00041G0010 [uncultured bacterium]|uniref:Uncharacterized protein n=2 Tax=Candidatus Daviesiibacteriota TaxID=1752718 RepID=A0A0G0HAF1_9BACT|nr:MAG: hypothetical protein ACD_30C00041G0010 [uncultured bacterium]KKQ09074.1 MAG: hypothetical protein US19_C0017G0019 [Candidatus Daviesbacteria bacterium GW2011_GWB1_36_5]KKQ16110.1 MAG: hypothetical protein US28_C0005G0025 [Candidatus Daviesbacteria bacterium GW2011_GWA1_36_8]OGE31573.1 MAG: hypothetical protein A3C99_03645 [Candidatus Daviesbacteria bacterium RIFCSPHIGHO2_02_FULL_37_9]
MSEREGGPGLPEKAVRYPLSILLFAASMIELVHLNVVVAAVEGILGYVAWPKSPKSQSA